MANLTTEQIGQLIELDERSEDGIGPDVWELIRSLRVGCGGTPFETLRETQACRYWETNIAGKLGFTSFRDYLATIPELPKELEGFDLVLVDARLSLADLCKHANVRCRWSTEVLTSTKPAKAETSDVYWMPSLRRYPGSLTMSEWRQQLAMSSEEVGLTPKEGIALYLQKPTCLDGRSIALLGSVRQDQRPDGYIRLGIGHSGPELFWDRADRDDDHDRPLRVGIRRVFPKSA